MSISGKLSELLSGGTGIVISSPHNRRYFTSFAASDGFLLVTSGDALFLTDSRYIQAAKTAIKDCETQELKDCAKQLPAFFVERGVKRVLFESDRLFISDFSVPTRL